MINMEGLQMLALLVSMETVLGCPPGFQWQLSTKECIDIDECPPPGGMYNDEDYDDTEETLICGENARCINTYGSFYCQCHLGFTPRDRNFSASEPVKCRDLNECAEKKDLCGPYSVCKNTIGNYFCTCDVGFVPDNGQEVFKSGERVQCVDRNECEDVDVCGQNAECVNTPGGYQCVCDPGFRLENDGSCKELCQIDPSLCGNGTCTTTADGHRCTCHVGFTNYGKEQSRCKELNCELFNPEDDNIKMLPGIENAVVLLRNSCLVLSETGGLADAQGVDGEVLLEALLSAIDGLLQGGPINDNRKLTVLLELAESVVKMIGPVMNEPRTSRSYRHVEVELLRRGADFPRGSVSLSSRHARLNSSWETAAGDALSYPGFATISLLTYKGLDSSQHTFFSEGKKSEDRMQLISKVVTASVSNTNTTLLAEPIVLTFYHQQLEDGSRSCAYWEPKRDGGSWSDRGCVVLETEADFTVCSCNHLSSFSVLMALHEVKDEFQLQVITWVGLALSLVCLFLCILTFALFRSIQSTRNTIHLHLCISLFIADFVFLAGIARTENPVGCGIVAGLLHYFFLAAFCWMCLEGVQLFRMVVLVFNTTIKPLYMMAGGYGVPAVIVILSAIANPKGYGTERYCWLSLEDNFIWSFFGPVCVIIMVNVFFFLITVWKLAQKFSSLNPDLDNIHKIKAFTVTAVAQLCVLGTMWIFGCFQFDQGSLAMSYLFTILNSLQGVLIFVMHCLFSKPVREEYSRILSRVWAPEKKKYSEFSSNQTSKSQSSKNTRESHI